MKFHHRNLLAERTLGHQVAEANVLNAFICDFFTLATGLAPGARASGTFGVKTRRLGTPG